MEKLLKKGGRLVQTEIDKKNFGCRHCWRSKQNKISASTNLDGASVETSPPVVHGSRAAEGIILQAMASRMQVDREGPREKPPPLFHFNGLRSHMKAK